MVDADGDDNPGDSDTTEGEQEEDAEGEETPVIDEENNSDENQEQTPDVEEDPAEDFVVDSAEEENEEPSYSVNEATSQADELLAPVITVKQGAESVSEGETVPNRAENVTFEIAAVEGVTFHYTTDGTEPSKESAAYTAAVKVTAPDKDTEETVTIKAVAYKAAVGTEAEQTSAVAAAEVVFGAKAYTISMAVDSQASWIYVNNEEWVSSSTSYSVTDIKKDVEISNIEDADGMFEVMYKTGEKGTWTSARKKGALAGDSFGKKYASYSGDYETFIIPKEALKGNVQVNVRRLNEITIGWGDGAGWDTVGLGAEATRTQSDSENKYNLVWGPQYFGEGELYEENKNKLFVAQNTEVTLKVGSYDDVDGFAFTSIKYKKQTDAGNGIDATEMGDSEKDSISGHPITYTHEISLGNVEDNDYTVTIDGTYESGVSYLEVSGGEKESKSDTYTVYPWRTCKVVAYDQVGRPVTLDDSAKVMVGGEDAQKAEKPIYSETGKVQYGVLGNVISIPIGGAALEKTITVTVGEKTVTLNVGPTATGVALKDAKLNNTIKQGFGTYVSYPINVTDGGSQTKGKKSKDDGRVVFENVKVTFADGTSNENEKIGEYVRAYASMSGNSLSVVTEPLPRRNDNKTVQSVEADLVIINKSRNEARTGTKESTDIKAEEKLQTLSLQIVNDGTTTKYAEKLTVKATKAASCLYTGQTAIVANVNFPAGTYNRGRDVEVYDIPEGLNLVTSSGRSLSPDAEGVVALSEKDNTLGDGGAIYLRADSGAALGKNIIKVRTTYLSNEDNNVVQATGSVNVTVARGIEDIDLSYAPQIYKADTKATAKITVNYNTVGKYADAKSAAPKTKKVTYEIGRMENGYFVQNDYPLGSYYKNGKRVSYVTVKNGTVTVDKDYEVEGHDDSDKFAVRVKAADYPGNRKSAVAEFKVVSSAVDMGKVVFVDSNGKEVKPENGSFTVNKLETLYAIVVKEGKNANANGAYKDEDIVSPKLYTMTPVKGNVVVERSYDDYEEEYVNRIMVNKLAKNVEIVATANDGSKNNKASSGKFNVVYDDTTTLDGNGDKAVQVVYTAYNDGIVDEGKLSENENVTLTYPTGTIIRLSVADSNGDPLGGSIYNLKLAAKSGAKVIKKSADNLHLEIIMNKKDAMVTLSGVTAVKGSDNKPITKTYKITNESLDTVKGTNGAKLKATTPNVTLAKGTKLYAGVKNQKLTFSMSKVAAADKENGEKEYARYVVVSAQNSEADTETLLSYLNDEKIKINPAVKEFTLTCDPEKEMPVLKKGASIAFTFLNRNGEIITQTTKAITVKTTALKKSYKLDAKYTLSERDAAKVPLTGKGNAVANVQFTKLYNANIKGQPNRFKEGFELDAEHGTIGLVKNAKGDAVADSWYSDRAKGKFNVAGQYQYSKNDFIGFVEYTVEYEDGTEAEFVTKITTALSKGSDITAKKYTASAVNVLLKNAEGFPMQGDTGIMVGKLPADIVAAYAVQESGKGSNKTEVAATDFKVLKTADTNGALNVAKINGNMITLEVKTPKKTVKGQETAAPGTYKGALYVVPKDSIYGDKKEWSDDEIANKGVRVPITINVKAVNSKSKIKVTAKSVSFLNTEPEKLALEGKFRKYYYAEIPYTANISAGITSVDFENINVKKNESEDKTNGLEFGRAVSKAGFKAVKVNGKNALGLYIDADAFRKELVANDDAKWSGSVFSKVKMTVHFDGEGTPDNKGKYPADGTQPESFNISITMPNPMDVTEGGLLLDKVLEIVRNTIRDPEKNAEVKGIADIVYDADRNVLTVIATDPEQTIEDAMTEGTDDAVANALLEDKELKDYVDKLQSIGVELNDEQVGTTVKNQNDEDANKQMLKDLLVKYRGKLLEKLEEKDKEPVWGSLIEEERKLTIKATSKEGITKTEECTLRFIVDENYDPGEYEGDDLDVAIKRAVRRINDAKAIPGVSEISYDVDSHKVTVSVSDKGQDIMASKNAGRDSTVQILLGELGEYMDNVEAVKFSYETRYEIQSITVKRETHGDGTTEKYISDLVDKWTTKLVNELGTDASYGRLIGKTLTVTTDPDTDVVKSYVIVYE